MASVVVAFGLSCSEATSDWDLPGPGIKPMSSALAGGFLSTAPSGKSYINCILIYKSSNPQQLGTSGKV